MRMWESILNVSFIYLDGITINFDLSGERKFKKLVRNLWDVKDLENTVFDESSRTLGKDL